MSEVLTIDTSSGILTHEQIDPLPLYDENFPMLRMKIPEYTDELPNPSMTKLIKRLKITMKKFGGIGLSANQCGVSVRVFVIGTDDFMLTCINPKIISSSVDLKKDNESCLSYPGLYLKIIRPSWLFVEFTNENGEIKQMKLEGVTARCFMHELDHMNGVRFIDHVGPVALQIARNKQQKIVKKMQRQIKNKKSMFV